MSRVGQNVKTYRLEANMSQKQLGKKIGVSENFINEIETGKRIINENLIDRIGKILNKDLNDITMFYEDMKDEKENKVYDIKENKVQEVWKEAFGSVLRDVNIFDYSLNKTLGSRKLPVIDNKVNGHPQDKVFYLKVEDNDMNGFRVFKEDLVLCHITGEIQNNSIYLIEHNDKRQIRQIKNLDNSKFLLISNSTMVNTEAVEKKQVKIIARLDKVEINL
ncbi:transcriptional regulator [Clostridium tetani]|uniref:DNA-binding protein n=1 Tax=Clostridium tetani TaxID=1513 RepID=A0A4Q0VC81_CLOTA|nr:XRE family transcriptional regulator [Clostridium tetani]RXI46582.1 DNA-binding protein [Clostridium tetani]BDR68424.1 transcriptional regulator [Clostridium tetani]BDR71047.1 transcriptional regulator [Clostridium tetani]BDR82355.1 transcriptional regulator [Clostridium tetani]BDR90744.1 transcriptional regulator [Clostridium tetani]